MAVVVAVVVLALMVVVVGAMVWQLLRLDEIVNKVAEVAATLANIQVDARTVASELAASQNRADATMGDPGEASDAAARSADG